MTYLIIAPAPRGKPTGAILSGRVKRGVQANRTTPLRLPALHPGFNGISLAPDPICHLVRVFRKANGYQPVKTRSETGFCRQDGKGEMKSVEDHRIGYLPCEIVRSLRVR